MPPADFLNQAARIELGTASRKGYGDHEPAWTLVPGMDAVPCMVRPLRPEAVAKQGRDVELVWVRIYFAEDPGVTRLHRLTVDGQVYVVKGELDFNSMGRLIAVDCTESKA